VNVSIAFPREHGEEQTQVVQHVIIVEQPETIMDHDANACQGCHAKTKKRSFEQSRNASESFVSNIIKKKIIV
jgi:hypothetical protein